MARSKLGVINTALGRIGQVKIASLTEDSTAAIQAAIIWDDVVQEILEAADWSFAKTRIALSQNATSPVQGYDYAYTLPPDFLKLCRARQNDPSVYPDGVYPGDADLDGNIIIGGIKFGYIIEALPDGTLCLFSDYDNAAGDMYINYIKNEANPARWTAQFATTVSYKLAADLAIVLTESVNKMEKMTLLYDRAIISAKGLNASNDFLANETASDSSWERAGR